MKLRSSVRGWAGRAYSRKAYGIHMKCDGGTGHGMVARSGRLQRAGDSGRRRLGCVLGGPSIAGAAVVVLRAGATSSLAGRAGQGRAATGATPYQPQVRLRRRRRQRAVGARLARPRVSSGRTPWTKPQKEQRAVLSRAMRPCCPSLDWLLAMSHGCSRHWRPRPSSRSAGCGQPQRGGTNRPPSAVQRSRPFFVSSLNLPDRCCSCAAQSALS